MKMKNKQSGFTMIESLVAFLIITIGLLGVGALQSVAIGSTKVAADRSVASIHTSALMSRMNSNDLFWQTISTTFDVTIDAAGVISDTGSGGEGSALEALSADCAAVVCTPAETASYNMKTWAQDGSSIGVDGGFADRLPAPAARIRRIGVDFPVMLELSLTWNEKRAASGLSMASTYYTATGTAANSQRDFTFVLRARP